MNWLAIAVGPAALAVALAIDRACGEPPAWAHPVVAMGRWLGWAGRPWPSCSPPLALVGGSQVARLCSRDTAQLSALQVRETAIETLAENLNDSVIAPLFWSAVAGLPGAVLYRYGNTADAMWGYRGRWEWAGKVAACVDDALSWLPARLTGLLLLPWPAAWPSLRRQARLTPSPNGGWAMGAMALRLGVGLGKPGVYRLGADGRDATADTGRAVQLAGRALVAAALLLAGLAGLIASLSTRP